MPHQVEKRTSGIWDAAVIGGGVAGSVAAIHLGRANARVVLLEKENEPTSKVCGGFIGPEGIRILSECGIDFDRLKAPRIKALRFHGPHRSFETRLPFEARVLSRAKLDNELLEIAADCGVEVRRGVFASECHSGLPFKIATNKGELIAKRLVLATGKSEFRSVQQRQGRDEDYVAYSMSLRLKPSMARRLSGHMDIFVFHHGYGSLSLTEGGDEACLSFSFERSALKELGSDWDSVASYIARHNWEASRYFDGADPLWKHFASIPRLPYGFIRRGRGVRGLFCVGDQMAVMPTPLGDGISAAAQTGQEAALAIIGTRKRGLRQPDSSIQYEKEIRRHLRRQLDSTYRVHLLFKNPQIFDWTTILMKSAPWIMELALQRMASRSDWTWISQSVVKRLPV